MKLLFNKKTFEGHWFDDEFGELITDEWTEKVPQHTRQIFDEEVGDWIEMPAENGVEDGPPPEPEVAEPEPEESDAESAPEEAEAEADPETPPEPEEAGR